MGLLNDLAAPPASTRCCSDRRSVRSGGDLNLCVQVLAVLHARTCKGALIARGRPWRPVTRFWLFKGLGGGSRSSSTPGPLTWAPACLQTCISAMTKAARSLGKCEALVQLPWLHVACLEAESSSCICAAIRGRLFGPRGLRHTQVRTPACPPAGAAAGHPQPLKRPIKLASLSLFAGSRATGHGSQRAWCYGTATAAMWC